MQDKPLQAGQAGQLQRERSRRHDAPHHLEAQVGELSQRGDGRCQRLVSQEPAGERTGTHVHAAHAVQAGVRAQHAQRGPRARVTYGQTEPDVLKPQVESVQGGELRETREAASQACLPIVSHTCEQHLAAFKYQPPEALRNEIFLAHNSCEAHLHHRRDFYHRVHTGLFRKQLARSRSGRFQL